MNIKEQSGITLVVLVMTVIVMLILTTTVLIGTYGYRDIKKSKDLLNDLENLGEKVNIYYEKNNKLPVSDIITDNVVTLLGDSRNANDGGSYYKIDLGLLDNIVLTYGTGKFDKDYFIVNEQSHNVYYFAGLKINNQTYYGIKEISQAVGDKNFGLESFELKNKVNATVTNGVADIQLEVYTDITNPNISKYKFKIDNEAWTAAQDGNSYIFHNLERFKKYKVSMMIIDKNNNEIYATNNEIEVSTNSLPINLTIDGKTSGTYNNPLIPAGFIPLNENGAVWQSSDGYKRGLVITDAVDANGVSTGNEFVWVPVDGTIVTYGRYDFGYGGVTYSSCSETLIDELNTTVSNSSINRNGGFYIARYEAGIATNMTKLTSDSTATYGSGTYKPVSKQGATVWNYIKWGTSNNDTTPGNGAVTVARSMYPTSNSNYGVVSTLIYAAQWDTALKFIQAYDTGEEGYATYATNSAGYGNHSGTDGKGDTFASTSEPTTCGAAPQFRQKNIYDMAGNVWEWTMEYSSNNRIFRGGYYNGSASEIPASYRAIRSFDFSANDVGFRVALYIKS